MLTIANQVCFAPWLPLGPGRASTLQTEREEGDISVSLFSLDPGGYLLFRAVASQVPSAYEGLTSVFGMGTGGTLQPNHRKFSGVLLNTLKTA